MIASKDIIEGLYNIISLLTKYRSCWAKEIIFTYPDFKEDLDSIWVDYLSSLSIENLFKLQKLEVLDDMPSDLAEVLRLIKELVYISEIKEVGEQLPLNAYDSMTEKKRHEVNCLISFLEGESVLKQAGKVIDYCGGAGYFGRTLGYFKDQKVLSIDFDKNLQKRGEERLSSLVNSTKAGKIEFLTKDVLEANADLDLRGYDGIVGIHTCAHLSDKEIDCFLSQDIGWLLNISCCYYKTEDLNYSFSLVSKKENFKLSKESLLLAARGMDHDLESFRFAMHVKTYRYMLHHYLYSEHGKEFIPFGGVKKREYEKSFPVYAKDRILQVLGVSIDEKELDKFNKKSSNQSVVRDMIACNALRVMFSRLVEVYIALDRAQYLAENFCEVKVFELFDPKISPRNIAIFAKRL